MGMATERAPHVSPVPAVTLPATLGLAVAGVVALAFIVAFVHTANRRRWHWTGLTEVWLPTREGEQLRPAKTLWDWLGLLVIPLVLAALAFALNSAQTSRDEHHADAQTTRDERHADAQATRDRQRADDVARENTLNGYLTQMSDLMLRQRLLDKTPNSHAQEVAEIATSTALRRLDGARKGQVLQFLAHAGLLEEMRGGGGGKVRLFFDDLENADLHKADLLYSPHLEETDLRQADLRGAVLERAELHDSHLDGARAQGVHLLRANLYRATLRNADLRKADLEGASLVGAHLERASLRGADLQDARLEYAHLEGTDLEGAHLQGADLRGAHCDGVNMLGADVTDTRMR
jgi:uncharacterized protein YjbI with pentapeptide repeats